MTTTEQVLQSATNRTNPWSYLGSVSSVSPVPIMDSSDTVRSIGQPLYNSTVKSVEDSYNGTGYFIDEEDDSMLSDIKTVIFACLATLVPLVFILIIVFGARLLWIQYKTRKKDEEFDGMFKENTTDSMTKPLHSHLLNDKVDSEISDIQVGFRRGMGTREALFSINVLA
ncbi:uncharacterized protein LOC115878846 [Sitophilus oryzae]|uniref:Uncharacterized protein LOC115878846 n=1 Tax=Sitophilus oryzae TaxID=7048 RepID=A0A6J2XKY6_SITOR|nr:uncharacterized protein LOC115878846 [Sitophilus oryzae]